MDTAEETKELKAIFKKFPKLKGIVRDSNYSKEGGYFTINMDFTPLHFYFINLDDVLKILEINKNLNIGSTIFVKKEVEK